VACISPCRDNAVAINLDGEPAPDCDVIALLAFGEDMQNDHGGKKAFVPICRARAMLARRAAATRSHPPPAA
jgi:hypothetical protein